MFCSRAAGAALLALCLAACSSRPARTVERVAVLPFENLSAEPSLDWMGRAVAEGLVLSLTGSPRVHPLPVQTRADIHGRRATQVLHGYFSATGGVLRLNAVLEDAQRNQTVRAFALEGPSSEGILPPILRLARQVDSGARSFGTKNPDAFKTYVLALRAPDADTAAKDLQRVCELDPGLGAAYLALVQLSAARGDRAAGEKVIEAAAQRGDAIPAVERAKLSVQAVLFRGTLAARRDALRELARLVPASYEVLRDLGEIAILERDFAAAASWYRKAAELEPSDPSLWNLLGYAHAYTRNLGEAVRALEQYRKLAPEDPNGLDSLGDVHYYLGRFPEAERHYLAAYDSNAAFLGGGTLLKAARARLMRGDVAGGDPIFRKYAELRKTLSDPSVPVKQAQWDYLCGRRRQTLAGLESIAASDGNREVASRAASQLVIWQLETGDSGRARQSALRAEQLATNPSEAGAAALCRFLTEPPASASEWALRAERAFPEPAQVGLKKYALAYVLLFAKEFPAAALVLKDLYQASAPTSPDPMNVPYAWALIRMGRFREARELIEVYPIPQPAGDSLFACLSFPRQFYLRALVFAKLDQRAESRAASDLFLKLSGDLPTIFQEER